MRTYRTAAGPFAERPFFKPEEIEEICVEALRAIDLYPATPEPVRIDRFIEKRFAVRPEYEDLPEGFLGYTEFGANGVQKIVVSRSLDEKGTKSAERRINTTLAHEAGHGLMHAHLFVLNLDTKTLLGDGVDPERPRILCRGETVAGVGGAPRKSYDGRWWEFQANSAIGGLLLPRPLVSRCLEDLLLTQGTLERRTLDAARRDEATRRLAEVFDVNPAVARIRLDDLFPARDDAQLTL